MPDWKINGGTFVNVTFQAALISQARYTLTNGGDDSASFIIPGDADGSPPLAEKDDVTFAYGTDVKFRGFVRSIVALAEGSGERFSVELAGNLQKLARTPLVQNVALTGSTTGLDSTVTLGHNDAGTRLNIAATITDLLTSTASRHGLVNGTILSGHAVTAPLMDMVDANAMEGLNRVLSWVPDAVLWYDHAAATVNVTKPAGLANVTTAGSGTGSGVVGIEKDKKRRFAVPGVVIIWKTTTTVDGVEEVSTTVDTAGTVTGMDVPVITIPLTGVNAETQSQSVTTETIPRHKEDFDQAEHAAFLKKHFEELKNWNVATYPDALHIISVTQVVDEDHKSGLGNVPEFDPTVGDPFPAYPRMLASGTVPEWQAGISAAPVKLTYKVRPAAEYADAPEVQKIFAGCEEMTKEITMEIMGTDAETQVYTTVVSYDGGESPVAGLAAEWHSALNASAPSFTITFVAEEARTDIYPGKTLTLTGDFASDAAVVQAVTVNIDDGITMVTCGPQSIRTPSDLVELMRAGSRRSPLVNRSGAHRTSAAVDGKVIKGAAAARTKNTAIPPSSDIRWGFRPFLAEPGVVKVSAGALIWNAPDEDSSTTFNHTVYGTTEIIGEQVVASIAAGDYIWAEARRERTLFAVLTEPSLEEFCQDLFTYADLTISRGSALPGAAQEMIDVWPLGRYTVTDGVEKVEVYHNGAPIYVPYLVWGYHSL